MAGHQNFQNAFLLPFPFFSWTFPFLFSMPEGLEVTRSKVELIRNELVGKQLIQIEHCFRRKKNGAEMIPRCSKLTEIFHFKKAFVLLSDIMVQGVQLGIELQNITDGLTKSIIFSFGLGATFCVVTKEDLRAPPLFYETNKNSRINLVMHFANTELLWALIDCTQFKNQVLILSSQLN